jgi:hypothetical protein
MSRYRAALGVRESVPAELVRLGVGRRQAEPSKPESAPASSR